MKALRILTFTLLMFVCIVGVQSPAPKIPQYIFKFRLNSVLGDMQDKLADEVGELNQVKSSVGRSSTKAANLLSKTIQIISYLEKYLGASPASTTCPVPGAKPSPERGLCYFLVTVPLLTWSDADAYCQALGGYLIQPLPLDTTLGADLLSLFPELATIGDDVWIDGAQDTDAGEYVYHNGYISTETFDSDDNLIMFTPPDSTPDIGSAESDDELPFICQFTATTVFPPFTEAYVYDEDEATIPYRKYLVDVEAVKEVHHHYNDNDGYAYPSEEYSENYHSMEGGYSHETYSGEGPIPENEYYEGYSSLKIIS